ncbi:hypothetical protein Hz2V105 [Helicoverpa zea nudivirus 2]|uniref:Uncharacterized protein n=1 Tax=Helicoverpa zea nudivirus 2 TaxID=1128424 RepID=G9I0D1_HZNV2|nr:orf105 gene product [Helicoverpa zea nudivirus 2]AEW69654.1 hypothetical protein Hz2V105 [Helicoverpa zea nudivirus 2]
MNRSNNNLLSALMGLFKRPIAAVSNLVRSRSSYSFEHDPICVEGFDECGTRPMHELAQQHRLKELNRQEAELQELQLQKEAELQDAKLRMIDEEIRREFGVEDVQEFERRFAEQLMADLKRVEERYMAKCKIRPTKRKSVEPATTPTTATGGISNRCLRRVNKLFNRDYTEEAAYRKLSSSSANDGIVKSNSVDGGCADSRSPTPPPPPTTTPTGQDMVDVILPPASAPTSISNPNNDYRAKLRSSSRLRRRRLCSSCSSITSESTQSSLASDSDYGSEVSLFRAGVGMNSE